MWRVTAQAVSLLPVLHAESTLPTQLETCRRTSYLSSQWHARTHQLNLAGHTVVLGWKSNHREKGGSDGAPSHAALRL